MTIWKKTTKCFLLGYKVFGHGYTQDNLSKPYMKNLTKPYMEKEYLHILHALKKGKAVVDIQVEKYVDTVTRMKDC